METPAAKYPHVGLACARVHGAGDQSPGLLPHGASVTEDGDDEQRDASACGRPLIGRRPGWKEGQ